MNWKANDHGTSPRVRRLKKFFPARWFTRLSVCVILAEVIIFCGSETASVRADAARGITYRNDRIREVPWSIHVISIDRSRHDLELVTSLGQRTVLGLGTLSEQISSVPSELGRPIAAINGDFYRTEQDSYAGDPRGLQILQGELVSAPSGKACFWIDPAGNPQASNVISKFKIIWPSGAETSFGLNEERGDNLAVLYTPRMGSSTRTAGGRELVLERDGDSAWLPLRPGQTYPARVRAVRETGNTRLTRDTLVLSLSLPLAAAAPKVNPGEILKISTSTLPDLKGIKTAIGGGPILVNGGKPSPSRVNKSQERHPRSAIGWNEESIFLVEVDGRQPRLSMGMTLPELTAYLIQLGCVKALNLDGGGSAEVWVDGRIANSPCFGRERDTANALILLEKDKKGSH